MASQRPIDTLVESFDINQRRKYVLKNADGVKIMDLYFKHITRSDRKQAQALAGSAEALDISTHLLCQKAELADGTRAFAAADTERLQRLLPETVLNELELFLFGVGEDASIDEAKND